MNHHQGKLKKLKPKTFVELAKISRELHLASKKAQEVSLTAKNARALTVRAGDEVLGFKAITNFIDELASRTIKLASTINQQALKIATMATDLQWKLYGLQQFDKVLEDTKSVYRESCRGPRERLLVEITENQQQQVIKINRLESNLEDIQMEIRSAGIIAVNAKIESAQSPNYQRSLDVIADDITQSTSEIKSYIDRSQYLMNSLKTEGQI